MQNNFDRMVRLAEEFFSAKTDPDQLLVTPEVIGRLKALHPATMSERATADGPVTWVLVFPTTRELMKAFLRGDVGERELFASTAPGDNFECVYLCSALVLPEYRGKGYSFSATVESLDAIRRDHPVTSLFVWEFSDAGRRLAESVARTLFLPLLFRNTVHR